MSAPASTPRNARPAAQSPRPPGRLAVLLGRLRPRLDDAGPPDAWMVGTLVALVAFGVVMVYSASAVFAHERYGDGQHFLLRQSIFATFGLALALGLSRVHYRVWRPFTYPLLASTFALLVVVLVVGRVAGGASRWIPLGPINVQPSELAKVALVFWLAYSLSKKQERIRTFSVGFLPHVLVATLIMALCMLQPDFGSAVMIALLTFVLLFAGGARVGYSLGALLVFVPIAWLLVQSSEYRMRRIRAFQDPFSDPDGAGYQLAKSLMGFGSGGVGGVGLGDSVQKLLYLPEAHTDFIGAIVGEELGFVGVAVLIAAYCVLVYRGLRAAWVAPDDYGTFLAVGISMFLGLQAFTNLAVVLGLLPTKGLVLPFMSYGGSSLLVNCAAVGVLLDVSRPRSGASDASGEGAEVRASRRRSRAPKAALAGGET